MTPYPEATPEKISHLTSITFPSKAAEGVVCPNMKLSWKANPYLGAPNETRHVQYLFKH